MIASYACKNYFKVYKSDYIFIHYNEESDLHWCKSTNFMLLLNVYYSIKVLLETDNYK